MTEPPELEARYRAFWAWFQSHETELLDFKNRPQILDFLNLEIAKIDQHLAGEFGPLKYDRRVFQVTAHGVESAFPHVLKLLAWAPTLMKWEFFAFHSPTPPRPISQAGITVLPEDFLLEIREGNKRVDVTAWVKGYRPEMKATFHQIMLQFLEEALGEYFYHTRLGEVDVCPWPAEPPDDLILIADLNKPFHDLFETFDPGFR